MLVSVCMTTYNGERYLKEQVDSILVQLNVEDELIVSDDGSTDSTLDILTNYNDPRIKIFHHKKESPQIFSFCYTTNNIENALTHAKGDLIFLADQDDVWIEGKVRKMKKILQECDLVLSDCSFVDANLSILVSSKISYENIKIGALNNLYKNGYLGSSMAFRRHILNSALPFPKNVPHDIWIGLVGGLIGRFVILFEVTMLYRRHDANVSSTNNKLLIEQKVTTEAVKLTKNTNSFVFKIKLRLIIIKHFIVFVLKYWHSKIK